MAKSRASQRITTKTTKKTVVKKKNSKCSECGKFKKSRP